MAKDKQWVLRGKVCGCPLSVLSYFPLAGDKTQKPCETVEAQNGRGMGP